MAPERTRGHADPGDLTGLDEGFERELLRRAGQRGYLGVSLPTDVGGGGRPRSYHAIVSFEAARFDAPLIDTAVTLIGAPVLEFGSPAQRAYFLPRMIRGEINACIAYTEADAGSDLSAIRSEARPADDGFVISGEKALVTGAHKADWVCLVARTEPAAPPRRAMSMFLVDMRTPGVHVSRRRTMNGWTLGELRLDGVRVGPDALLGERGRGFAQMARALATERSSLAHLGWAERLLGDLVEHCLAQGRGGEPRVRERLARLHVDLATGLRLAKRVLWMQDQGGVPGHEAAMSKLFATELLQRIARTGAELLGLPGTLYGALFEPWPQAPLGGRLCYESIERIHPTVSAGSSEIQRNAIAHQGLGLPRT